jgi:hypothetical protein
MLQVREDVGMLELDVDYAEFTYHPKPKKIRRFLVTPDLKTMYENPEWVARPTNEKLEQDTKDLESVLAAAQAEIEALKQRVTDLEAQISATPKT